MILERQAISKRATKSGPKGHSPMRRDALARERLQADRMIRFVIGPGDAVMPDLGRKLPGRGVWLKPLKGRIEQAVQKGVFTRAARRPVTVAPDLGERVEALLMARMLETVSLARRAGQVVCGFDKVADGLRGGQNGVLLIAEDAGGEAKRLIAMNRNGRYIAAFEREALGHKLGRAQIVYALVSAGALAERLVLDAHKLAGFREFEMALDPASEGAGSVNERVSKA